MTAHAEPMGGPDPAATRAAAVAEFQRRDAWRRRLPLLPALLFTILVTQVPFLVNIWFSLQKWTIVPPRGPDFIGLENFTKGYSNQFFLDAVRESVTMTVAAVLLSLVIGTVLALLLDRRFSGRGVARTLLITPFLIMPVVAGLLWKNQIFNSTFGVLNAIIEGLGFDAIPFVERYPFWSIVTVLVWQWSPFMMLIILAGLQSQPTDILEAARVDRASNRGIFTQITLPLLRPYMELGIVLGAIYLLQVFDHVDVMTGGGPGSTNVPYFVYQRSIGGGWDFGLAAAYSSIVVIATIIIAPSRCASSPASSRARRTHESHGRGPAAPRPVALGHPRAGVITWLVAALFFFPVFWMLLNSFKTELVPTPSRSSSSSPPWTGGRLARSPSGPAQLRRGVLQLVPRGHRSTLLVLLLPSRPRTRWPSIPSRTGATRCSSSSRRSSSHRRRDPPAVDISAARAPEHAPGAHHPVHGDEPAAGGCGCSTPSSGEVPASSSRPPRWTAPACSGRSRT